MKTLLTLLCIACFTTPSFAKTYTLVDLGTLGGITSVARGINNLGQVVGESRIVSGENRAFLWDPQQGLLDLGTLRFGSHAYGINDHGQVVGYSTLSAIPAIQHAFIWNAEQGMQSLGTLPGRTSSRALAINNKGQIAGWSGASFLLNGHAVLWENGEVKQLDTISTATAYAINTNRRIVGMAGDPFDNYGFVWENDEVQYIPPFSFFGSIAYGVNDAGNVVGSSPIVKLPLVLSHPFLLNKDGLHDLGVVDCEPGYYGYGEAKSINNLDIVVGQQGCLNDRLAGDGFAAVWDSENGWKNLNDLIEPNQNWSLDYAHAINDKGHIVGEGRIRELSTGRWFQRAFLLLPN